MSEQKPLSNTSASPDCHKGLGGAAVLKPQQPQHSQGSNGKDGKK